MTVVEPSATVGRTRSLLLSPFALAPVAALVWWGVGFLPWIVDLFGDNILSVNGYRRAALPLLAGSSVYGLLLQAGFGSVVAGLLVRLAPARRVATAAVVAGVLVAVVVTLVQARSALGGAGAVVESTDPRLLGGLTAVVVVAAVVGLVFGLLAATGRAGTGIALGAVAGLLPLWTYSLLAAASTGWVMGSRVPDIGARWLGAVVLVLALVVVGVRPAARLLGWVATALLAWIVSPTLTAAGYLGQGVSRGPRSSDAVREQISASWQVWRASAQPDARPLTTWIVAIVSAGVLAVAMERRRTR